MGQNHRIVNLSRAEEFGPSDTGEFQKLMEFGHNSSGAAAALMVMLSGSWAGDRVAVLGDYGSPEDLPAEVIAETGFDGSAYDHPALNNIGHRARSLLTSRGLADFHERALGDITRVFRSPNDAADVLDDDGGNFVVWNIDKNQYLDPDGFGDSRDLNHAAAEGGLGGTTTALVVLLAASARGGLRMGGEIDSTSPLIGSWAGDRLMVASRGPAPEGAVDLTAQIRTVLTEAREGAYDVDDSGFVLRDNPFRSRTAL